MDLQEVMPGGEKEKNETSERKKKVSKNLSEVASLPNEGLPLFEDDIQTPKNILID